MVFRLNVMDYIKQDISTVLSIPRKACHEKYLDFPTFCGWDKSHAFSYVKEHLH